MTKKLLKSILIAAFWLAVWELLALRVGKSLLLPAPSEVLPRLWELASGAQFWRVTALSLARVLSGVALGVACGALLAVVTSAVGPLRELTAPLVGVVRATPVVSFIVLAILWLGRALVPGLIAALMVLPVVWTNVSAGIANTDRALLEMARSFALPPLRVCRRVYVPSVMPHFLSACRSSLGLGWKAGITAEVLTVPPDSIGKMLSDSKLYMETVDLFAWTLVIVVCSLAVEKLMMAAIGALGKSYAMGGEAA